MVVIDNEDKVSITNFLLKKININDIKNKKKPSPKYVMFLKKKSKLSLCHKFTRIENSRLPTINNSDSKKHK